MDERDRWNDGLRDLPGAHVLQTWEWGEFKRATGKWQPTRLAFKRRGQTVAQASLLARRAGPFKLVYASKGPCLDWGDAALAERTLDELERRARRLGVVWLKIDPDVVAATGLPGSDAERVDETGAATLDRLRERDWRFSSDQVQFRNTFRIDLGRDEDAILAAMSGGARRKIRLADRRGVTVREAGLDELPLLYRLYSETAQRDQFFIRAFHYYERAWADFMRAGLAQALVAEYDGAALAHVILFRFGRTCWYFYGASTSEERGRMPNYALQWAAIRWAKAQGCQTYDMWGAPDSFDASDRLWGVYQFKRGYRGRLTRYIGAWDFAASPLLYYIYGQLASRALSLM